MIALLLANAAAFPTTYRLCSTAEVTDGDCDDYETFEAAQDVAIDGDIIQLAPGRHAGGFTVSKSLTLNGAETAYSEWAVVSAAPDDEAGIVIGDDVTIALIQVGIGSRGPRGILVKPGATLQLSSSIVAVSSIVAEHGAGIYAKDATLAIESSEFVGNRSSGLGGHIAIEDAILSIDGCRFFDGWAALGGGAVAGLGLANTIDIRDSEFTSNGTREQGGAVGTYGVAEINILRSVFRTNYAKDGGAVSLEFGTSLTVQESTFVDNVASLSGGSVYRTVGDLTLTANQFIDNQAAWGGAVASVRTLGAADGDIATLMGNNFCGNSASIAGGAISYSGDHLATQRHDRLVGNSSIDEGGAIALWSDANLTVSQCNLLGNTAFEGGAIHVDGAILSLQTSLVAHTSAGGGLAILDDSTVTEGYNAWFGNFGGHGVDVHADTDVVDEDPLLHDWSDNGNCYDDRDWPLAISPLRDAAPGSVEADGVDDIGAYGGMNSDSEIWSLTDHRDYPALWRDSDDDGSYAIYDCNDADPDIYPGAVEVYNDGVDANCDWASDYDEDGDGFLSLAGAGLDCDDLDPNVYPNAEETPYDGIDQDCNGTDQTDLDQDGFWGGPDGPDCDDEDPGVFPGARDDDDEVDRDCDGFVNLARGMSPRTCDSGGTGGWFSLLVLVALRRRYR